jgi:hypothetical protein
MGYHSALSATSKRDRPWAMNGGMRIGGWHAGTAGVEHDAPLDLAEHALVLANEGRGAASVTRLTPAIVAGAAALAWVGGTLWLVRGEWTSLGGIACVQLLGTLATGPALIGIGWLLIRRNSRFEARRFGRTAAAMRTEAAGLERTVATLAAAIDTNRIKLAEQTEQLAAIGTVAAERLHHLGQGFTAQIADANLHAEALASAAHQAQSTIGELLDAMPRARAETNNAADLLEQTGLTAARHAAALEAQLGTLAQRGREADEATADAAHRLADGLDRIERARATADGHLTDVVGQMSTVVDALAARTAEAVARSTAGIAAQGNTMLTLVTRHQDALDGAARDSADALAARLELVDVVIDRIQQRLDAQQASGASMIGELDRGIAGVEHRLDDLTRQGVDRSQLLAASISALGGSADAMTEALKAGDVMATRTIGTTEALLVALDSAAREIDETLPEALARLDARLGASKGVIAQTKPELLALVTAAQSTHDAIEAIADVIAGQRATVDQLSGTLLDTLSNGRAKADALGAIVDETIARANRFGDEAAPRLVEALLRVRDTASTAADRARDVLATVIPDAARAMEVAGTEALRRAATGGIERQVAQIAEAADRAVAAADGAAAHLADRLNDISATSAVVEARIDAAHAERDTAERDTLARQVSFLIEALNSASIDLAKSMAPDISDSAWAAYLKGDRGVFTRRAVRLLDTGDARDIARLYDDDGAFREQVNRYIHDFEAMLRTVLAQRDGSPLGVTLLSSDMGKLYVALAQAIDRLR